MSVPVPIEQLWTVSDVEKFLGVGKSWVYEQCTPLGDLPCMRLGPQTIRFDPAAVRAWAASKMAQKPAQVVPLKGVRR